jgi:hypothetical protein
MITPKPSMVGGVTHHGDGVLLVLKGCREHENRASGLALFPECLRSELHEVRSVIEKFSNANKPEGSVHGSAAGPMIPEQGSYAHVVKVVTPSGTQQYTIDRWE